MRSNHATQEVRRTVRNQSEATHPAEAADVAGMGTGSVASAVVAVVAPVVVVAAVTYPVAAAVVAATAFVGVAAVRYASRGDPPGDPSRARESGEEETGVAAAPGD